MRWILIIVMSACVALAVATIAAAISIKPTYWLTWLAILLLTIVPMAVAYIVGLKLKNRIN